MYHYHYADDGQRWMRHTQSIASDHLQWKGGATGPMAASYENCAGWCLCFARILNGTLRKLLRSDHKT